MTAAIRPARVLNDGVSPGPASHTRRRSVLVDAIILT